MRNRIAAALAAVLAALTFAAGGQADAATGCATRTGYLALRNGQTPARVAAILHTSGAALGKGRLLEARVYAACDGTHTVYVNFKRRRVIYPRRAYFELWGY